MKDTQTAERVMSIRQMCDAFDVTPRTLRFYEAKELLFPERDGQKRLYHRADRARLKLILRGKRFGFSLEEIRSLLELYERGPQQRQQLTATLNHAETHLAEMIERRSELDEAIADLQDQMRWVRGRIDQLDKN